MPVRPESARKAKRAPSPAQAARPDSASSLRPRRPETARMDQKGMSSSSATHARLPPSQVPWHLEDVEDLKGETYAVSPANFWKVRESRLNQVLSETRYLPSDSRGPMLASCA